MQLDLSSLALNDFFNLKNEKRDLFVREQKVESYALGVKRSFQKS